MPWSPDACARPRLAGRWSVRIQPNVMGSSVGPEREAARAATALQHHTIDEAASDDSSHPGAGAPSSAASLGIVHGASARRNTRFRRAGTATRASMREEAQAQVREMYHKALSLGQYVRL